MQPTTTAITSRCALSNVAGTGLERGKFGGGRRRGGISWRRPSVQDGVYSERWTEYGRRQDGQSGGTRRHRLVPPTHWRTAALRRNASLLGTVRVTFFRVCSFLSKNSFQLKICCLRCAVFGFLTFWFVGCGLRIFSFLFDGIGTLFFVWSLRVKITRTVLCCVVCDSCALWHTLMWEVLTVVCLFNYWCYFLCLSFNLGLVFAHFFMST